MKTVLNPNSLKTRILAEDPIRQGRSNKETTDVNMQVSSKLAKLGTHLTAMGKKHRELDERISEVEKRPLPDSVAVTRLKRQRLRLKDEMQYCEGMLRSLAKT